MKTKIFENMYYVVIALLILAQCVIGPSYLGGQGLYLAANVISLVRCYALDRPRADKLKDYACTALTLGLIFIYLH